MESISASGEKPDAAAPEVRGSERFGHFVVYRREDGELDALGAGAMGITYRGFDTQLERPVALKVINPHFIHNPEVRSRFAREAKAAARLQHPNIAAVLFQGEEDGTCFYAMELVAGENLQHYVERVGPLSPVHALQMAQQIALALVAAAKEGVLHRDLKPANVMLTSYHEGGAPHLKVIDFGLAKLSPEISGSLTTGGFLGTPEFASPEQCEELPLDERSDLYSLGVTLWYLLTASPLFAGSMLAVMKSHVSTPAPFETLPGAPEPLLAVLRRLLAKDREERPATALDAVREIDAAIRSLSSDRKNFVPLGASGVHVSPPGPARRTKKVVTVSMAAACTAALVTAGYFFWGNGTRGGRGATPPSESQRPSPVPYSNAVDKTAFVNSLEMRFVAIPGLDASLSVWETRVRDFAAFIKASGYVAPNAGPDNQSSWNKPGFPQDEDHPVVYVSVVDALRFCEWLTATERKAGRITAEQEYRLPSRLEWDIAAGFPPPSPRSEREFDDEPPRPFEKRGPGDRMEPPERRGPEPRGFDGPFEPGRFAQGADKEFPLENGGSFRQGPPFYWGNHTWPPPAGFGNYADESALKAKATTQTIPGWTDGFPFTAPVGQFPPSRYGVFDLSGNVSEILRDGPRGAPAFGSSGGNWASSLPEGLQAHRMTPVRETERSAQVGFRCILAPVR